MFNIEAGDGSLIAQADDFAGLRLALRTLLVDDGEPGPLCVTWQSNLTAGRTSSATAFLDERTGGVVIRR
jgi:hypothetical protein